MAGGRIIEHELGLFRSEKGQDLAEYGLLVGFIAFVVIVGATLLGNNLLAFWNSLSSTFPWP